MKLFLTWLAWAGGCLAVGALGGIATGSSVSTWYVDLKKPAWNPPSWVFGPVWTALYLMMGTAAWRVSRAAGETRASIRIFLIQLLLNAAWSWCFFYLRSPLLGLVDIALLWMAIAATAAAFARLDAPAAWLMAPYLLWVTFAGALNFKLWWLNG